MFLVNFVGSYPAIKESLPLLSHHNTYCSYADTIMPQFFFAVGFSFRLTYLKRRESNGTLSAIWHAITRNFALLVVALFVHGLDGKYPTYEDLRAAGAWQVFTTAFAKSYFQTLTHIAFASLWILPVIGANQLVRIGFLIFSAVLFHLLSMAGYYEWVTIKPGGVDGGVLGFMSWSIPTLLGTLAYDWTAESWSSADRNGAAEKKGCEVVSTHSRLSLRERTSFDGANHIRLQPCGKLLAVGFACMFLGYALSCLNLVTAPNKLPEKPTILSYLIEPPFVAPTHEKNIWTMSQKAGAVSYMLFGGGFSMALYAVFLVVCDYGKLEFGLFRTLGVNALAGYILHGLVNNALERFIPKNSPLDWIFTGFAVSLMICYACLWHLERHKIYLRL